VIHLSAQIRWPWFKEFDGPQKDYFYRSWAVTKHKTLEIQVSKGGTELVGASIDWRYRTDHAGITIDLSLFRRFLMISFCDNRHWNDEAGRYVNYDNPDEVEKCW
jgi:hypothetical protein